MEFIGDIHKLRLIAKMGVIHARHFGTLALETWIFGNSVVLLFGGLIGRGPAWEGINSIHIRYLLKLGMYTKHHQATRVVLR